MLTRRHIRVKVMQCIYALNHTKDDTLEKQLKFLRFSIDSMYSLYLAILSLLIEVHKMAEEQVRLSSKKYLENDTDSYPDKGKFVKNRLLVRLAENERLGSEIKKRRLNNWDIDGEYVKLIYKEMVKSQAYREYMTAPSSSFQEDSDLVATIFKETLAPNEKVYDHFEDAKLTWVDDLPIVNTFLMKQFKKVREGHPDSFFTPRLLKDVQDMQFAEQLLTKTLLKNGELETEIEGKTPNWDKDRIADVDGILLKMAICELLNFPSIPEKVTINEFLEIAKEYSTPKSSLFINGVLDKLVKEYKSTGKLQKIGRGLL